MKCEYRQGIKRASIIFPYWTDITYSEDPEVWKRDLEEHRREKNTGDDWKRFFNLNVNETYGGFGFDINSLEELEELSKYFKERGFSILNNAFPIGEYSKKERVWYALEGKYDRPLTLWMCNLYIYPLEWKDYPKLREALLDLWKIGYLVSYKNFKYY